MWVSVDSTTLPLDLVSDCLGSDNVRKNKQHRTDESWKEGTFHFIRRIDIGESTHTFFLQGIIIVNCIFFAIDTTSVTQFALLSRLEIWHVDTKQWVIHDSMPHDTIQSQGQGYKGPKFPEWPILKSISSVSMHVIKRLTVNYDTPRQYLNFNQTNFWYSSLFGVMWPLHLGCSTFDKPILQQKRSWPTFIFHLYFSVYQIIQRQ